MIDLADCDCMLPSVFDIRPNLQFDAERKPYLFNGALLSLSILLGRIVKGVYSPSPFGLYATRAARTDAPANSRDHDPLERGRHFVDQRPCGVCLKPPSSISMILMSLLLADGLKVFPRSFASKALTNQRQRKVRLRPTFPSPSPELTTAPKEQVSSTCSTFPSVSSSLVPSCASRSSFPNASLESPSAPFSGPRLNRSRARLSSGSTGTNRWAVSLISREYVLTFRSLR
jgi:hypothetical protein